MSEQLVMALVACCVGGFMAGFLIGGFFVQFCEGDNWRKRIIKAGLGRWVVDEKTGRTAFKLNGER